MVGTNFEIFSKCFINYTKGHIFLEKVALRKEYFGPFAILVLVVCRQNGTTITLKKGVPEHITYMLENMVVSRIQHNIGTKARKIYTDRLNN
jgi:hypothetical protein